MRLTNAPIIVLFSFAVKHYFYLVNSTALANLCINSTFIYPCCQAQINKLIFILHLFHIEKPFAGVGHAFVYRYASHQTHDLACCYIRPF